VIAQPPETTLHKDVYKRYDVTKYKKTLRGLQITKCKVIYEAADGMI
jgi:hypothetical protein